MLVSRMNPNSKEENAFPVINNALNGVMGIVGEKVRFTVKRTKMNYNRHEGSEVLSKDDESINVKCGTA